MKIKRIISAFLALGIVATATPAFAADGDLFHIGTPINLATGEASETLAAGDVVALPIDVTSTTNGLSSFDIRVQYDNTVFSVGYADDDLSDDQFANLSTLGSTITNAAGDIDYAVNAMGTWRRGTFTAAGTAVFNPAVDDHTVAWAWAVGGSQAVNADAAEAYVILVVKKDVDANELNQELFKVDSSTCNLADSPNGKTAQANVDNKVNKVNACATAFQVNVDNDALATSGFWIQKLYAKVGDTTQDLTICNNKEGTAVYSFPTRVLTNSTGNDALTVDVYATVTTDEAGTANATDVKVATFNLTADGTATNYGTANTVTSINK